MVSCQAEKATHVQQTRHLIRRCVLIRQRLPRLTPRDSLLSFHLLFRQGRPPHVQRKWLDQAWFPVQAMEVPRTCSTSGLTRLSVLIRRPPPAGGPPSYGHRTRCQRGRSWARTWTAASTRPGTRPSPACRGAASSLPTPSPPCEARSSANYPPWSPRRHVKNLAQHV